MSIQTIMHEISLLNLGDGVKISPLESSKFLRSLVHFIKQNSVVVKENKGNTSLKNLVQESKTYCKICYRLSTRPIREVNREDNL
jgi:hypothetical protein